ncbi:AraC family transcriptional regulator [uncultured Proteiniphilum sp.]|uniref:helix-turn-helix domain-containing protein n=1 Tax=uncultured Proteiniphilum sp. TaxID=497637 RepID=UPI002636A99D|nr:AraC family transcriptional regulator [uncultured Proteiniphilum sp.]
METKNEEYITFNYSDIVFSYYFSNDCMCSKMVRDHFLVYVYSGEYVLEEGKRKTVVRPGEYVFMRRDNRVEMTKQPKNGEPFMGIFICFKRKFLREVFQDFEKKDLPHTITKHKQSVIKLPETPDIKGLFLSITPYFDSSMKPSDDIMYLKMLEGLYALLRIDERFYPTLFDFTEPWKIDILDFLNENYMYELSVEDIASFTGRSLSTLKRDFKKISNLSPEKWLIQRRLEVAYEKLKETGKSVTDVYMEVGFKNFSHFSSAFKKQYGMAPSNYIQAIT